MALIEILYIVFSATLTLAGLSMVGMGIRAYKRTERSDMIYLSMGFVLIVASAIGTTISVFMIDFSQNAEIQTLRVLAVNYLITTVGFLFVMYSLTTND